MSQLIKKFSDGSILEFDNGVFDQWCVYLTRPAVDRLAPTDVQYFTRLSQLAATGGPERLYDMFVELYERTNKQIDQSVLTEISKSALLFGVESLSVDIVLTILYAGMVAEENKVNTKLGKRVKRLGVYQVLMEGGKPEYAANFSKGKSWREIEAECVKRGF